MSDPLKDSASAARPLRIGMLCPGYPGPEPGDGRGIFVQHLVRELKARGHRVCVLTSRILPGDRPFMRVDEAEEVHRFAFWSEGKLLAEYQRIPVARMMTYMVSAAWLARRVFGRFDCNVIHTHFLVPTGIVGAAAGLALRRPHVLTVHGSDPRMALRVAPLRPAARWTLRYSGRVIATAPHVAEQCLALGADPARLSVMPMGIDARYLQPEADADKPEPRREPAIISTRTLREDPYSVSTLIEALALLARRGARPACTIAGDGPDRARLEALTRDRGLGESVRFVGWTAPERLAPMLRRHLVYVSTSRADGASVSLLEAMASGALPVVSDIAANRAWVEHGENGLLFPAGDAAALADALVQALSDPDAAQGAAREGARRVTQSVSWPALARRTIDLYQKVIKERERSVDHPRRE